MPMMPRGERERRPASGSAAQFSAKLLNCKPLDDTKPETP